MALPVCASARLRAQAPAISVNQNPVRAAPLVLHWPTTGGTTSLQIFTITGAPVTSASLASDPGRFAWDLTATGGAAVVNGAYVVVVIRGDNTRMSRRVLVAR